MKKILTLTFLCGLANLTFSQNFGIGQANPAAKLHVTEGDASYALFGPNSTWNSYLYVGAGASTISSGRAQVISTNGNLHLDAGVGQSIYIANYNGSNTFMQTGGGNVGIGTTSPGAKLEVAGQVKITGGSPGVGKVLTSDASGLATWESSSGALDYGTSSTGGPRPVGNFGQFQGHSTTTDFNTVPGYWGWNYVQGSTNAPNTTSSQWYRGVFSLGSQYPARGAGGYSLELAVPRYNQITAGAWVRTVEGGTIGPWSPLGPINVGCVVQAYNNWNTNASGAGYPAGTFYSAATYTETGTSGDTRLIDQGGVMNTSAGAGTQGMFTAPADGFYLVTLRITGVTNNVRLLVSASLNEAYPTEIYDVQTNNSCTTCHDLSWSGIIYLLAGDTHRIVRHGAGSAISQMIIGYALQ